MQIALFDVTSTIPAEGVHKTIQNSGEGNAEFSDLYNDAGASQDEPQNLTSFPVRDTERTKDSAVEVGETPAPDPGTETISDDQTAGNDLLASDVSARQIPEPQGQNVYSAPSGTERFDGGKKGNLAIEKTSAQTNADLRTRDAKPAIPEGGQLMSPRVNPKQHPENAAPNNVENAGHNGQRLKAALFDVLPNSQSARVIDAPMHPGSASTHAATNTGQPAVGNIGQPDQANVRLAMGGVTRDENTEPPGRVGQTGSAEAIAKTSVSPKVQASDADIPYIRQMVRQSSDVSNGSGARVAAPEPVDGMIRQGGAGQAPLTPAAGKPETASSVAHSVQWDAAPDEFVFADKVAEGESVDVVFRSVRSTGAEPIHIKSEPGRFPVSVTADALVRNIGRTAEISLQPEELGRVRMTLSQSEQGLSLVVTLERPETLDLMRRHIDQLIQEFRKMGHDGVGFEFRQEGGKNSNHFKEKQPNTASSDMISQTVNETVQAHVKTGLDMRL